MLYVLDMRPVAVGVSMVVIATDDAIEAATVADKYATEFNASVVIAAGPPLGEPGTVAAAPATALRLH